METKSLKKSGFFKEKIDALANKYTESLKADIKNIQASLCDTQDNLDNTRITLEDDISVLREYVTSLRAFEGSIQELQDFHGEATATVSKLQRDLATLLIQVDILNTNTSAMKAVVEANKHSIQEAQAHILSLESRQTAAEECIRKISEDLENSIKSEIDDLQQDLKNLRTDYQNDKEEYRVTKDDFGPRLFRVETNVRTHNKNWEECESRWALKSVQDELLCNQRKQENNLEQFRIYIANSGDRGYENSRKRTHVSSREKTGNEYRLIDYFDFENHFRGPRADIKQRQRIYLPYFQGRKNILDLGCGRGEFVELLTEEGMRVRGVDSYPAFVKYCQIRSLPVIWGDALDILRTEENIDGIFAGQLIEHLTFEQLQDLCQTAFERLIPDGILVMETPNPMSLAIYTHAFYMDPSHIKPVHPLTIQYMLQKCGFRDVKLLFIESSKLPNHIPELIIENNSSVKEFNQAMAILSDTVFGCQDYAVIAQK